MRDNREIAAEILIAALASGKLVPDGGTSSAQADSLGKCYEIVHKYVENSNPRK
jgi:hypothetical protein